MSAALLLVLAAALLPQDAPAQPPALVRIGVAPVMPAGATPLAEVASSQRMRLTVTLDPRHPRALARYVAAVSDPTSPDYRLYLRPGQFASRFGASLATIGVVRHALQARGLAVGRPAANRLSLPVSSTVAGVEHAFELSLRRVWAPGFGAAVLASDAPAVDARIAGDVQAVIGLDGLQRMSAPRLRPAAAGSSVAASKAAIAARPRVTRTPLGAPQACAAAADTASLEGAYTATQIAQSYGFDGLYDTGDLGRGVTVALYELEPDATSDVATYARCYGVGARIAYVKVDGGAGKGAGSGEATFDIEQLIGLAPKIRLLVYQGPNTGDNEPGAGPYDTFAAIVADDRAQIVTNSWGECEPLVGATAAEAEYTLFEEAAVQGQTVVSAGGDNGSEDCTGQIRGGARELAVDDPASQPLVTGVGGSSMTVGGVNPFETVWNDGPPATQPTQGNVSAGAGGGGLSSLWQMPSYQQDAPPADDVVGNDASGAPCGRIGGLCREVPDVSADADPNHGYMIYFNGAGSLAGPRGWQASGGTSGAAPVWAAVFALTDADPACGGLPIGFANPMLYELAATPGYFHDITIGDNDFTGQEGGRYGARPGYDLASGLGTPITQALAAGLCARALRVRPPGAQLGYAWSPVRMSLDIAGPAGVKVTLRASGLPAGIAVDAATGTLAGTPRKVGRRQVSLVVTDWYGSRRVLRFAWTVAGRPALAGARVRRSRSGASLIVLPVSAGRDAPGIVSVRVLLSAPGWRHPIALSARVRRAKRRLVLVAALHSPLVSRALMRASRARLLIAQVTVVDARHTVVSERAQVRVASV